MTRKAKSKPYTHPQYDPDKFLFSSVTGKPIVERGRYGKDGKPCWVSALILRKSYLGTWSHTSKTVSVPPEETLEDARLRACREEHPAPYPVRYDDVALLICGF